MLNKTDGNANDEIKRKGVAMAKNKYYQYENIHLWEKDSWQQKMSVIYPLVIALGKAYQKDKSLYAHPFQGITGEAARELPFYVRKTKSIDLPEAISGWKKKGVHYECRSQAGKGWVVMAPEHCLSDYGHKMPVLVVMCQDDLTDPYWSMKLMEKYRAYNELVATGQDLIVIYIVSPEPDIQHSYVNILEEAFVFVPGDTRCVYLDVGPLLQTGKRLAEIEGFQYTDRYGNLTDPDAQIISLGSERIPVLNISGLWESRISLSYDQITSPKRASRSYDREKTVHNDTGRLLAEGMALEYRYNTAYDQGFLQHFENMGLLYGNHEYKFRRWKAAVPMEALETPEVKLPLLCVMSEVSCANEHLAVTEAGYYYEYFRIAAQGECILLNFVLEDADSNDLLDEIIDEAMRLYPMIDPCRIYLAGHSHNGNYVQEFTLRHPQRIAAQAVFGDPIGLTDSGLFPVGGERLERLKSMDVPLILLAGYTEFQCHFPYNATPTDFPLGGGKPGGYIPVTFRERVAAWQLRLEAYNCRICTEQEITATRESSDHAVRKLGIPADRSETIWMDGNEIYIADIQNVNGDWHLRIVGEENMPHNTTPAQQKISWSFLRKFAKDPQTGKTIQIC